MYAQGIRLIGELVPYLHGWRDYSNRNLSKILDAAGKQHMVVSFYTMPDEQDEITRMVLEHPGMAFVTAHPGGKAVYMKHLERMELCGNLHLDFSGTGISRYGAIAYGVERVSSERFLFGTDYPICNPRMYVQAIYQAPVSEADRANIMHSINYHRQQISHSVHYDVPLASFCFSLRRFPVLRRMRRFLRFASQ